MSDEIVLGYDGSDGGKAALEVAINLSRQLDRTLVIAYAYEVSQFGGEVQDLGRALHERGDALGAEALARAREAGVDAESVVEHGDKAEALARLASDRDAGMIVVGTRGESTLKGLVLGSVAHKLLHLATTPVLVVPNHQG
jgi:nucleotide-binding universal stress UspA family protein